LLRRRRRRNYCVEMHVVMGRKNAVCHAQLEPIVELAKLLSTTTTNLSTPFDTTMEISPSSLAHSPWWIFAGSKAPMFHFAEEQQSDALFALESHTGAIQHALGVKEEKKACKMKTKLCLLRMLWWENVVNLHLRTASGSTRAVNRGGDGAGTMSWWSPEYYWRLLKNTHFSSQCLSLHHDVLHLRRWHAGCP